MHLHRRRLVVAQIGSDVFPYVEAGEQGVRQLGAESSGYVILQLAIGFIDRIQLRSGSLHSPFAFLHEDDFVRQAVSDARADNSLVVDRLQLLHRRQYEVLVVGRCCRRCRLPQGSNPFVRHPGFEFIIIQHLGSLLLHLHQAFFLGLEYWEIEGSHQRLVHPRAAGVVGVFEGTPGRESDKHNRSQQDHSHHHLIFQQKRFDLHCVGFSNQLSLTHRAGPCTSSGISRRQWLHRPAEPWTAQPPPSWTAAGPWTLCGRG